VPRITHILFDFFGTLVTYVDRLEGHEFPRSHDLVRSLGADLSYPEFLAASEWNAGVCPVAGIADLLTGLAAEYRLAVVSNTQDAILVPDHLRAMGVRHLFDAVTTSLEVGWRKPNPRIYAAALREFDVDAVNAVFVGDSYIADYVGPSVSGIRSFLIDPRREAPVPEEARLASVLDLPARLEQARGGGAVR
jgi:putative hydrolase of the HAD superfamily